MKATSKGETPELMTIGEVAAMLRLRPSTIRAWLSKRKQRIPYVKLGSRVFVRRSDVESLIAASLVPARQQESGGTPRAIEAEEAR